MSNVLRRTAILAVTFMMSALACHADWFKGRIVNAETGEPLVGANVSSIVNPQPGWSICNYAIADSTGSFKLYSVNEGRIMLTVSMIGYKNVRKVDYSYGKDVKDTIDLGTIKLPPTALMLREVEVKASIPRVTMAGDTIVFNPEAFKLKEGARLDELIKKLPGVENRDGQLYWNNKPIRLMMNGKDMFGGGSMVSQLPAEAAKKLKLYDKKSELARHTGKDDGEEDTVLDIEVKPGFLDKWYGDVELAYQTKKRYLMNLGASKLSDNNPQMLFIQANNANRYYERNKQMSLQSNIDNDGKSQYGTYVYQHNWQTQETKNLSHNRFDFGGSLVHNDGWGTNNSSTETFFPNQDRNLSLSKDYHYKHKLSPRFQSSLFAYADTVNNISVSLDGEFTKTRNLSENNGASYSYEPDQFLYYSLAEVMGAKPGDALYEHLVTRNRNYQTVEGLARQFSLRYAWNRYLGKKGSFGLGGKTQVSGENRDTYNNRSLEYLREGRSENKWQFFDYSNHNILSSLGAKFDRWLSDKVYVSVADNVTYSRYRTQRNVFADTDETLVNDGKPTTPDNYNRNDVTVRKWSNQLSLQSTVKPAKPFTIMPKFVWQVDREDADYQYGQLDTATVRNTQTFTPSMFFKWKISRVRSLDLSFAYNTTVPELANTFAFTDTTDPLSISTGNGKLGNTHSHTTAFGYHRMWLRKQIVLGLNASYTKTINPLTTLFRYNPLTGVYTSQPVNVKGGDQWKVGIDYDQGLGIDFRLMNKFSIASTRANGFLTITDNDNIDAMPSLNHQKQLAISENLELSYEVEKLQLTLFNNLTWNRYHYDATSYNSKPLNNQLGLRGNVELGAFSFNFDVTDYYRHGYLTKAMNGHRVLANAYVSYSFNKNKCTFMLLADDIFNKDNDYESDYTAYQRTETSTDYLHHYVQLKFRYRFDAKEDKKKK